MAISVQQEAESFTEALESQILAREATVAIIGLGYVGLPLAIECAGSGFPVVGIDSDLTKVAQVNAGRSYIRDVPCNALAPLVARGRLRAGREYSALAEADIVVICVPTPITRNKEPDVTYITQAVDGLRKNACAGQLIILRSTSYPGTTEELVRPPIEARGLRVGRDVFVAFAPERINPGTPHHNIRNTPIVVGGCDPESCRLATCFFQQMTSTVVPVSTATAAEMVKLLENVFRNVNIALVNQMTMLCDRMGLNIWEIVEAAGTKPYGFMPFRPGLVGGHCIPVDPYFLAWRAREYDFHADFIELAARVNDAMPYFVVNKVIGALNKRRQGAEGASALVLGVSFKKDVDDCRHSPALKVIELLIARGVQVSYHDPYATEVLIQGVRRQSVALTDETVRNVDCVIILTDHSAIPYGRVVNAARLIIDGRNATREFNAPHVIKI